MNAWIGYGLCATGDKAIDLRNSKQPVLRPTFGGKAVPDVVHRIMPPPVIWPLLSGVTRDSTGTILGSCSVDLMRSSDDLKFDGTTSDAAGNFTFKAAQYGTNYYIVAYKPGSPDVAGTSVATLQPT
jgi:hypothetical protein